MTTLDMSSSYKPIVVPRTIAVCPICGAKIVIEEIQEWECETGLPLSISLECVTEPDIESARWPEWHQGHWSMPYVDWLPLELPVLHWLQKNFKCA